MGLLCYCRFVDRYVLKVVFCDNFVHKARAITMAIDTNAAREWYLRAGRVCCMTLLYMYIVFR